MGRYTGFECLNCEKKQAASFSGYLCPHCGGNLNVLYDYAQAAETLNRESLAANSECSVLRYLPVLPAAKAESFPPVRVGMTPLYDVPRTARKFGLGSLYI
ncbi:MAG: hypothetical protein PHW69_07145, partial [Elusimicrobiaceae bacterium]|nr:hypothetical protein [Elusimicrobiaceae bacterium]